MPGPERDDRTEGADPAQDSRLSQPELVANLVDELQAAEDRAEMLTYVLAQAHHDLFNLQTAFGGYSTLMLAEAKPDDPAIALVKEIILSAERMSRILARMAALAGKGVWVRSERCDLTRIVSDEIAQEMGTRPDLRLEADESPIVVDLPQDGATVLVRTVLSVARSTAPTGPIQVTLRVFRPVLHGFWAIAHVRLRVTSEAPVGLHTLPHEMHVELQRAIGEAGVAISHVTDGRLKIDVWLPQSRTEAAAPRAAER